MGNECYSNFCRLGEREDGLGLIWSGLPVARRPGKPVSHYYGSMRGRGREFEQRYDVVK